MRHSKPQSVKSSVVIARMLASEGYTTHVHNKLRQYSKRLLSQNALNRYERIAKAMKDVAAKCSQADRLVIGRFIAWQTRFAMDTGVRIGLAATLTSDNPGSETNSK